VAIETAASVRVRFDVRKRRDLDWIPSMPTIRSADQVATLGISAGSYLDAGAAARQALDGLIDHLVLERGLTAEQAYVLSSVAADLQLSALVNAPNALVSAVLPLEVFE